MKSARAVASLLALQGLAACVTLPPRAPAMHDDVVGTWVLEQRRLGDYDELTFFADGRWCQFTAEGATATIDGGTWTLPQPSRLHQHSTSGTWGSEPLQRGVERRGGNRLVMDYGIECTHCNPADLEDTWRRVSAPRAGSACTALPPN